MSTAEMECRRCGARMPTALLLANGWERHPTRPGTWFCGRNCKREHLAQEHDVHSVDGGSPEGRALLAAAAGPAVPPPRPDIKLVCKGCREACLFIPAAMAGDATQVQARLRAEGWTSSGCCGQDCARTAPKAPDPAPGSLRGVTVIRDISYQTAWAASRRRAGLPTLPQHAGLLAPEIAPAAPAPPPPPAATKPARAVKSSPLRSE